MRPIVDLHLHVHNVSTGSTPGLWRWALTVQQWTVESRTEYVIRDDGAVRTTGTSRDAVLADVLYAVLERLGAGPAEGDVPTP